MSLRRAWSVVRLLAVASAVGGSLATAAATAPADASAATHSIGVVGGETTSRSLLGYETAGGDELWPAEGYDLDGGTIFGWVEDDRYLAAFDAEIAEHGQPGSVWWQLTGYDQQVKGLSDKKLLKTAKTVLAGIRERVGADTPVLASAMSPYDFYTTCFQQRAAVAPGKLQNVVTKLTRSGLVEKGPLMPLLYRNHLEGKTCLQNERGQELDARVLLRAFGD